MRLPLLRRLAAADSALRQCAVGDVPGELGARLGSLLAHGRRTSTKISYDGKQRRFQSFCTDILPDEYGLRPRSWLPASEKTVIMYLAHLSREGKVAEQSLQPYLSAVNQLHQDAGFPRPAVGHFIKLVRKGYVALEADANGPSANRVPAPAELMLEILRLGLATPEAHPAHVHLLGYQLLLVQPRRYRRAASTSACLSNAPWHCYQHPGQDDRAESSAHAPP